MHNIANIIRNHIKKPYHSSFSGRSYQSLNRFKTMKRNIQSSIILNETESNIRNLLVDFCGYYNSNCDTSKQLVLRITGGWVRDKLLGHESNDLDIAINHLSGEEFASQLRSYLVEHHPDLTLKAIHTIKKNPAKSKHLETCTTKLFGLDIDFVNLRSEEYSTDSRVPIIECGTAEEDALRRDATLNALFYNLNQGNIEDFTGKGLDDLKSGILRTPLQPLQTFLDDPLRVLRLIRFASRFDFSIELDTLNAMTNDEIKSTLIHKISRERIGVELEKILTSNNPEYGLNLINYVGLTQCIFNVGPINQLINNNNDRTVIDKLEASTHKIDTHLHTSVILSPIFKSYISNSDFPRFYQLYNEVFSDKQSQKLFWLSTILQPFDSLSVKTNPKKAMQTNMVEILLKEGLRYGKHEFEPTSTITKEADLSHNLLDRFFNNSHEIKRSELGLYLKKFDKYLNINIVFNCFNDIIQQINANEIPTKQPSPTANENIHIDHSILMNTVKRYEALIESIIEKRLTNVDAIRPLIDGKSLSKMLNMKPGPWMGKINSEILVWQLDNPEGSQEDCLEYVKQILSSYI